MPDRWGYGFATPYPNGLLNYDHHATALARAGSQAFFYFITFG